LVEQVAEIVRIARQEVPHRSATKLERPNLIVWNMLKYLI
jgi:hypothetical protein